MAYCHFVVSLAFFLSEKVPYSDIKTHLKYSLQLGRDSAELKAAILHNLAVVNYCELSDHNDRIFNGDGDAEEDQQMLE